MHNIRPHEDVARDPRSVPLALCSEGPRAPSVERARSAERSDAAVHERRHGPVQGRLHRQRKRDYKRATTSQKCIRASGKHNDLESVGVTRVTTRSSRCSATSRSATTSREDAIKWAWELTSTSTGCRKTSLVVTVFEGARTALPADDEAEALWRGHAGGPEGADHQASAPRTTSGRWATRAPAARAPRSTTGWAWASPTSAASLKRRAASSTARAGWRSGTASSCSSSASRRLAGAPRPAGAVGGHRHGPRALLRWCCRGQKRTTTTDLLRPARRRGGAHQRQGLRR
jgi:hypothetical protein